MKDLVIFDLKNTLVTENKEMMQECKELVTAAKKQAEVWLYSIVEPWTFEVLKSYKEFFDTFDRILLVKKKNQRDLSDIQADNIWVVGDDLEAELLFAQSLSYKSVDVVNGLSVKQFMEDMSCQS